MKVAVWLLVLGGMALGAQDKQPKEPGFLGVSTEELSDEDRAQLKLKPEDGGVRVTSVTDGSAAAKAGVKEGDVILKIDGAKIEDTGALSKTIREKGKDTEITASVLRDGKPVEIKAKLGGRTAGRPEPADSFPPEPDSKEPLRQLVVKCGTEIPWITAKTGPQAALDEAKAKAAETKRLILWYVFRVPGAHIQRHKLLDRYMLAGPFSDPDVSELIRRKFVPLRLIAAREVGPSYGLKALDAMEPALVFLRPDGTLVHKMDRIRSMNADLVLNTLRLVLEKEPELNRRSASCDGKEGLDLAAELIRDGDYAKAAELLQGSTDERADLLRGTLLRRQFKAQEALESLARSKAPEARLEEALVLLRSGKIDAARKAYGENAGSPEAKYYLGVCEYLTANEPKAVEIWKELAASAPDSVWAWRAAACASGPKDCFLGDSGLTHAYEDPLWPVEAARHVLLSSSDCPRSEKDLRDVAHQAVRFLLRHQRSNGSWSDSRYIFGQGPVILPNVWVSVTAMASAALLEWRELEPEAVDRALARSMPYLLDEKNMNRGKYETSYADGFRLVYLARRAREIPAEKEKLVASMNDIVEKLGKQQGKGGFWWHEYPNCFITGMVMYCLQQAQEAGATVPKELMERGAAALSGARNPNGVYPYATKGKSAVKDSSGRMPLCELALWYAGQGSKENIEKALEAFLEHEKRRNVVRKSDFHADGELAGFFFYHSHFPAIEAARVLDEKKTADTLKRLQEILLALPEADGSFAEDHEVGKSYSTAMALLCLKRLTRP